MQNEHIVRDMEVSDGGRHYKASYFVEHGILHTNIDGRMLSMPVGSDDPEQAVKRLLLGHAQMKTWRQRFRDRWSRP